jgi:hypothetical protein
MVKRRTVNTMVKRRRTVNTMVKRRRRVNTMVKRRTVNTMVKRKGETMISKTLLGKLKIAQYELKFGGDPRCPGRVNYWHPSC